MICILYNKLAGNGHGADSLAELEALFKGQEVRRMNYVGLDTETLFSSLSAEDTVILCGGDGTINRLANDLGDREIPCPIYLSKNGTGNDFYRDMEDKKDKNGLILLNPYLKNLPTVTINGKTTRYINGIGYGLDGTACEIADQKIAAGETDINYTSISIGLLLGGYHCPNATVTVDGVTQTVKKVWLASAMNGRYYGGGMLAAPNQDRTGGKVTCLVWHGTGKLSTLMHFLKIFKGEHVRYSKSVKILEGDEITVSFDRPNALQIDGETVLGVTSYTVRSARRVKELSEQEKEGVQA